MERWRRQERGAGGVKSNRAVNNQSAGPLCARYRGQPCSSAQSRDRQQLSGDAARLAVFMRTGCDGEGVPAADPHGELS